MSDEAGEKVEIDSDVHARLKDYCDKRGLKMGHYVTTLVRRAVGGGGSSVDESVGRRGVLDKLNESWTKVVEEAWANDESDMSPRPEGSGYVWVAEVRGGMGTPGGEVTIKSRTFKTEAEALAYGEKQREIGYKVVVDRKYIPKLLVVSP